MRDTISRFTAPLFALLPDFSAAPARREATFGITISIIFHLLLLLAVIIFGGLLPERLLVNFAKSKPSLQEIELTVIPPEPKPVNVLTVEPASQRDVIDSRGLAKSNDAPENPTFESDENMKAASELAARGTAPLPTQDGRTDRHSPDFANTKDSLGKPAAPPAPDVPMPPPKPPAPDTARPAAQAKPPEPLKPTPKPLPEVAQPTDNQIALAPPPVATPEPPAPPLPKPLMRATAALALLSPSTVRNSPEDQPLQEKTRVDGVISNRGNAAVSAIRTPLGRYDKQVTDAIRSRWRYYVKERMDLMAIGSLQMSFAIDAEGKVVDLQLGANTSNASFADVCERAVTEAEIAPPPPEVRKELRGGRLDRVVTFTLEPPD